MTMTELLNRFQIAGTLIQSAKQVVEGQEIVRFEFNFNNGNSTTTVLVRKSWLKVLVLEIPHGSEVVVSGDISVDQDGHPYLTAYRVDSPAAFKTRFANTKRRKQREDALKETSNVSVSS